MATWVDFAIVLLLVLAVLLEIKRGFGRAIFDLAAIFVAMRLAFMLSSANSIKLSADAVTNQGILYLVGFVVIGAILVFVGHIIYTFTPFTLPYFDLILGGVVGIFAGIILCHVLAASLQIMAGDVAGDIIGKSALAPEFVDFTIYHKVLNFLYNFNR